MTGLLAEKIHDNRFLRLSNMLRAGYLEDWEWNATLSGAPQGGVASPVLSNIYLDRLDKFAETVLIPEYTRGKGQGEKSCLPRGGENASSASATGTPEERRPPRLRKCASCASSCARCPTGDPDDPGYRRLRYLRYADDHLLGFTGPKAEAEKIKQRLAQFLRDELKLELNPDKTLITHARTRRGEVPRLRDHRPARRHQDLPDQQGQPWPARHERQNRAPRAHGSDQGQMCPVPQTRQTRIPAPAQRPGRPRDRRSFSGPQYRGIVQYYLLAGDVWRLDRLRWVMQTSMLKTLAAKHRSSVAKMAAKHKAAIDTPLGPRRCFEARAERAGRKPLVTRFGGIPLTRQKKAVLNDRPPAPLTARRKGSELIHRLKARRCEWCGQRAQVQAHQVRKLADLTTAGAATARMGAAHGRTTAQDPPGLPALPRRHPHTGNPPRQPRNSHWRARFAPKDARTGFGPGAAGKGPAQQAPRQWPTGTQAAGYRWSSEVPSRVVEEVERQRGGDGPQPAPAQGGRSGSRRDAGQDPRLGLLASREVVGLAVGGCGPGGLPGGVAGAELVEGHRRGDVLRPQGDPGPRLAVAGRLPGLGHQVIRDDGDPVTLADRRGGALSERAEGDDLHPAGDAVGARDAGGNLEGEPEFDARGAGVGGEGAGVVAEAAGDGDADRVHDGPPGAVTGRAGRPGGGPGTAGPFPAVR